MEFLDDRYVKASRYDLEAQAHNRRVFHRHLLMHPWQALSCAIGMSLLAANAAMHPRWVQLSWMGWILVALAGLMACYFLTCALQGWRNPPPSPQDGNS
jgi:hypothetical protein